jgi:hypothetical protein
MAIDNNVETLHGATGGLNGANPFDYLAAPLTALPSTYAGPSNIVWRGNTGFVGLRNNLVHPSFDGLATEPQSNSIELRRRSIILIK